MQAAATTAAGTVTAAQTGAASAAATTRTNSRTTIVVAAMGWVGMAITAWLGTRGTGPSLQFINNYFLANQEPSVQPPAQPQPSAKPSAKPPASGIAQRPPCCCRPDCVSPSLDELQAQLDKWKQGQRRGLPDGGGLLPQSDSQQMVDTFPGADPRWLKPDRNAKSGPPLEGPAPTGAGRAASVPGPTAEPGSPDLHISGCLQLPKENEARLKMRVQAVGGACQRERMQKENVLDEAFKTTFDVIPDVSSNEVRAVDATHTSFAACISRRLVGEHFLPEGARAGCAIRASYSHTIQSDTMQ
jgi:hypothetical protein